MIKSWLNHSEPQSKTQVPEPIRDRLSFAVSEFGVASPDGTRKLLPKKNAGSMCLLNVDSNKLIYLDIGKPYQWPLYSRQAWWLDSSRFLVASGNTEVLMFTRDGTLGATDRVEGN